MPEHPSHQPHQTKGLRTPDPEPLRPAPGTAAAPPSIARGPQGTAQLVLLLPGPEHTKPPKPPKNPAAPEGGGKRTAIKTRRDYPVVKSKGPPKVPDSKNAISYVRRARYRAHAKMYRVSYLANPTQQKVERYELLGRKIWRRGWVWPPTLSTP